MVENLSLDDKDAPGHDGPAGGFASGAPTESGILASGESTASDESTDAQLLGAIVTADQMINSMMSMRATLIETLRAGSLTPTELTMDPGDPNLDMGSVTAELACALRLPHSTAAHLLDDARVLAAELPATAAALESGSITYRHAQVMINHIGGLDPRLRVRAEKTLVPRARRLTVSAFARAVTRERDRLDPLPLATRHDKAATARTVLVEGDLDGMAWLHAHLPAVQAHAIFNRLSDAAAALQHPTDLRTLPQLRADALVCLTLDNDAHDAFTHALHDSTADCTPGGCGRGENDDASQAQDDDDVGDCTDQDTGEAAARERARLMRQTLRGIRPTVAVTVPVLTLLGGDQPGELEGYGPIDPDTARQLCSAAPSFLRILTHPHTSAILGVDRDRYTVPADLKAWLRLRDEHCRFPGCARRATRCEIDHVTDWALGGTTDQTNLIHLCAKHHHMRHRSHWTSHITTTPPGQEPHTPNRPGHRSGSAESGRPGGPGRSSGSNAQAGPLGAAVCWTAPSGRTYTTTDALTERGSRHSPGTPRGWEKNTDPPPETPETPETPAGFPDIPPF